MSIEMVNVVRNDDDGVGVVRQHQDDLVDACIFCGSLCLRVGNGSIAPTDVVFRRIMEQEGILEHIGFDTGSQDIPTIFSNGITSALSYRSV